MKFYLLIFILILPAAGFCDSYTYLNCILQNNTISADKNLKRLSSGIQLLTDDPAYKAIYEKLESQMRALDSMVTGQQDMINYYTYEEAVLANVTESLNRIRELALQMGNSLLGDTEKDIIRSEMRQHYEQVLYELRTAQFNTKPLFSELLKDPVVTSRLNSPDFYTLGSIDTLLQFILQRRVLLGSWSNRLRHQIKGDMINQENTAEFQSHGDTDYGRELSEFKRNQLLLLINVLMLKPR